MQLSYKIVGLDQAKRRIKGLADATPRFLVELVTQAAALLWYDITDPANWAVGAATPLPPPGPLRWITGDLARATKYEVTQTGKSIQARVYNDDPIAVIHEDGGSRIPARPFIAPAYLRKKAQFEALFRGAAADLAARY